MNNNEISPENLLEQQGLEQRIKDLEILQDIYEAVARDSLATVLKRILSQGLAITNSNYAGLWLYGADNQEVYLTIDTEQDGPYKKIYNHLNINSSQQSIVKRVFQSKKTYLSLDVAQDDYYLNARSETKSQLTVPMIYQDHFIGLINFESNSLAAFKEEGIKLVEALASQAAIAIEIASLKEQKAKENSRLEVYIDLLAQLIQANENTIFDYIHQNASELMDANNMYIALYDNLTNTVTFGIVYVDGKKINVNPGEEDEGYKPRQGGKGKTETIIQTKKPLLHTNKAESEQWYNQQENEEYVGRIPASWVGVPMTLGEKVIGVIATYNMTQENVYNQEDIEILEKFADWAAMALETAQLSAKEKQKTIALEKANQKIAENERFLTRSFIVQDFVHRLNNLVGTIPVWVNLIRDELTDLPEIKNSSKITTLQSYLDNIYQEANDLLKYTERLNNNESVNIDVNKIVRSILTNLDTKYRDLVDSGYLILEIKIDNKLYQVEDIASSISNSLANIISNAVEAIIEKKQPGILTVCTQYYVDKGKRWVRIDIQDTGIGIPLENQDKIFTLFFSTKEKEAERNSGKSGQYDKGYGVWRAKNAIEKLGGKINFISEHGVGTTFTVLLPPIENYGEK